MAVGGIALIPTFHVALARGLHVVAIALVSVGVDAGRSAEKPIAFAHVVPIGVAALVFRHLRRAGAAGERCCKENGEEGYRMTAFYAAGNTIIPDEPTDFRREWRRRRRWRASPKASPFRTRDGSSPRTLPARRQPR